MLRLHRKETLVPPPGPPPPACLSRRVVLRSQSGDTTPPLCARGARIAVTRESGTSENWSAGKRSESASGRGSWNRSAECGQLAAARLDGKANAPAEWQMAAPIARQSEGCGGKRVNVFERPRVLSGATRVGGVHRILPRKARTRIVRSLTRSIAGQEKGEASSGVRRGRGREAVQEEVNQSSRKKGKIFVRRKVSRRAGSRRGRTEGSGVLKRIETIRREKGVGRAEVTSSGECRAAGSGFSTGSDLMPGVSRRPSWTAHARGPFKT